MPRAADIKPLLWQGAAGRKPTRFVPVEVTSVKPDKGGVFGIQQSPSIAGAYPDAQTIEGMSLGGSRVFVKARAPGAELPRGLATGQRLVLGLVDDTHFICFIVPPADVPADALARWASEQPCR